jgi:cytosine/adenosine deaminase-related metal-dependent hydrolase
MLTGVTGDDIHLSGHGIDFLENWIQQNVTEADRKGSQDHATELAAQCYADAAAHGITIDDMEPEWRSVEEIIYDAMQDVLGDELVFWKTVAAIRERRKRNETLH